MKSDFKPTWTECNRFHSEHVAVIVFKSDHHFPRYSYELQFRVEDRCYRNRTVPYSGHGTGHITIQGIASEIQEVVTETERWIERQMRAAESTSKSTARDVP